MVDGKVDRRGQVLTAGHHEHAERGPDLGQRHVHLLRVVGEDEAHEVAFLVPTVGHALFNALGDEVRVFRALLEERLWQESV